jgi:hypothetical protein
MLAGMNALVPYSPEPRKGLPLRIDRDAARESAVTSFIRACAASLIAAGSGRTQLPETIARSRWPNDRDVALIARAPSSPGEIGNSGWAGTIAHIGHVVDHVVAGVEGRATNFVPLRA